MNNIKHQIIQYTTTTETHKTSNASTTGKDIHNILDPSSYLGTSNIKADQLSIRRTKTHTHITNTSNGIKLNLTPM